jgi:DnaJ-class molecular chaperone
LLEEGEDCEYCDGTGIAPEYDEDADSNDCEECGGSGKL